MKALNMYNKNILGCLRGTWSKTRVATFEMSEKWVHSYVIEHQDETYVR